MPLPELPVIVADQALDDEALVALLAGEEGVELGRAGDRVHALARVAVRHLDHREAAPALHPQRDLVPGHVPQRLGRADAQPRGREVGVVEVVRLGRDGLVATAGQAGEHRVEEQRLGQHRDAIPRPLRHVAKRAPDRAPGAVAVADLHLPVVEAHRRIGIAVVEAHHVHGLAEGVGHGRGIARVLHRVLVVDHGQLARGHAPAAHQRRERLLHEHAIATLLVVLLVERHGLLSRRARVGLDHHHLPRARARGDVHEVAARPAQVARLEREDALQHRSIDLGIEVREAHQDPLVAQAEEEADHGVHLRIEHARIEVALGRELARFDELVSVGGHGSCRPEEGRSMAH